MGTNCAPLLADLLLYSYESEFLQKLVKDKKIHEARAFNRNSSRLSLSEKTWGEGARSSGWELSGNNNSGQRMVSVSVSAM
jgi:hypothetical protein